MYKQSVDFFGPILVQLLGLLDLINSLRQQTARFDQRLLLNLQLLLDLVDERFRDVEFAHPAE